MNFEFGMTDLVIIAAAVLLLSAFVASIAWVWRDADRRGQPGFIVAVLVAFLLWPFSLIVWLLARPQVGATPTAGRPLSSHEGIITLSPQVGATPTAGRQRGVCGVCGVVLLVVLLGIGIIIGGTIMFVKIRNYNGSTCLDQVSVIATAYLKYQDDNGRPPEYLAELGLRNLRCPSGSQSGPSTVPYELLPGTEPTDIIVREVWTNHGGKGGAIAFGDGSVAWVDSPYKPIRMDVVKAQVERQLREWFDTIEKKYAETLPEGLGEKSVRVGAVTFDPKANRYQVVVHWQAQGKKGRDTMSLNQTGQGGMSRYSGRFGLVLENVPASVFNPILPVSVDELMEREDWAEKN